MSILSDVLQRVGAVNEVWLTKSQARLDQLAIPRGSLGRLMEIGRQFAAIRRNAMPAITKRKIFVFAADHGVAAEGVSAFPQEVTRQMVFNFVRGGAGINVLARHAGVEVAVVDIGVDYDFPALEGLLRHKVAKGTKNMACEPAMTRDEALKALEVGIGLARAAADDGYEIIGTGDMGIGNTTASSAIIAVFSGRPAAQVTGRGTGISESVLAAKIHTIERALYLHRPNRSDPVDVLAKVGGLEIAGIAGLILGAAAEGLAVVIDGFISTAGAVIAYELNPSVKQYLFAAHLSVEQGHRSMLEHIGLRPLVELGLRLGEGTGAAIGIWLVEAGVKMLTEILTFEEAGVAQGTKPLA